MIRESDSRPVEASWSLVFSAWLVALAASLGALFIGEVMGQLPCNLCWYQRAFMFPLVIILAVASFNGDCGGWRYGLPLTAIGALIAGFHSLTYAGLLPTAIQPCGEGPSCSSADMTIFGGLPLPYLSLVAFLGIAALLILARRRLTA
jgi:disulfide bond formation protein DsbB